MCINMYILNLLLEEEFAMPDIPHTNENICAILEEEKKKKDKPKTSKKDKHYSIVQHYECLYTLFFSE